MSKSIARLKDTARTHEQREEWDQAIGLYLQVLHGDSDESVGDLPLYNRVGDLYLRTGRPDDAVRYYEQAADRYSEAGLYNNAIALCNKALRYAPQRIDLLRKLGRFSASQGFLTDARRWFLEFAERAFNSGDVDDAFAALDDFADIADDPEIRELLARKMYAHGRIDDALIEYKRAYSMRVRSGPLGAAESIEAEIRERYPDLLELDTDEPDRHASGRGMSSADALPQLGDKPAVEPVVVRTPRPPIGLPPMDDAISPPGFESTSLTSDEPAAEPLPGIDDAPGASDELDEFDESVPETPDGLEATSLADDELPPPLPGLDATPAMQAPVSEAAAHADMATAGDDAYVDLSDLLGVNEKDTEGTRFFVQETDPTGDEDRDFAELLAQFRQKIAENVAHDDIGSHYDLGLAFKEMGLLDEAISEFQVALRAGDDRLKIFEELGQCFLQKKQFKIAVKVLSRALQFESDDEIELIGVYYHLGRAFEELSQRDEALDAYERVVGLDINFKDVANRMAQL